MHVQKKKPLWIPVVTALLKKNSQVLVGLRPEGHALSGLWEFPGGKIEPGESPEHALRRELNEELGIDATIGRLCYACTHTYGTASIVIIFYEVNFWKGEPKSVHHTQIQWVDIDELPHMQVPEANKKAMPQLLSILRA